LIKYSLLVGT